MKNERIEARAELSDDELDAVAGGTAGVVHKVDVVHKGSNGVPTDVSISRVLPGCPGIPIPYPNEREKRSRKR